MKTPGITRLRALVEDFVAQAPARRNVPGWWRKPLVACAPVDRRFEALPRIAASDHLQPQELLPAARTVIVFFIPFRRELVAENAGGERPCRNWGVSYMHTNELIGRVSHAIRDFLAAWGFQAGLTPATHNFNKDVLMARWSHKHLGRLVGLGRFGTHNLLITPAGCAGRLGSLVTDADLGEHPLAKGEHACLRKAGKPGGRCIRACPVDALAEEGFDRRRCWQRLVENRERLDDFADLPPSTHVCGKCAALVPCSFKNPVAGGVTTP